MTDSSQAYLIHDSETSSIGSISSSDSELGETKTSLISQIALELLTLTNQIKIFHWQTKGYAEHKALDKLFDILNSQNDRWVETAMGKYGRIHLSDKQSHLPLVNLDGKSASDISSYLTSWVTKIRKIRDQHFKDSLDSDLSNIFDELFGSIHQTCYLLSLN